MEFLYYKFRNSNDSKWILKVSIVYGFIILIYNEKFIFLIIV